MDTDPSPPPSLLSARELANRLGIHVNTVYELVKKGEITHVRIGGLLRFDPTVVIIHHTGRKGVQP